MLEPTCIERAFTLAQSGECESMQAIRVQLKAEGYSESGHLRGSVIRGQLMKLIAAIRQGKKET